MSDDEPITPPHFPLDAGEWLRCTRCDEMMTWNRHSGEFECSCRAMSVSAGAIKQGWVDASDLGVEFVERRKISNDE